jgi:hypothetical protein
MKQAILVFIFFIKTGITIACQCSFNSITEEIKHSDLIFTGKVIRRASTYPVQYTFSISETFKGVQADSVVIKTGSGGGDCGMPFELGKIYLIYSTNHETSRCRRNAIVETNADITLLRYTFNPEIAKLLGADTSANLNKEEAEYFNSTHRNSRANDFSFKNKRVAIIDQNGLLDKKKYFSSWGGKDSPEELLILTPVERDLTKGYDAVIVLLNLKKNKGKYKNISRKKILKQLSKKS